MGRLRLAGVALLLLSGSHPALAAPVAYDDPGLQAPSTLQVSIPGLPATSVLPTNYAADGRNISPPVTWSGAPATTRAYVVLMQDADAPGDAAAVHWLAYDIAPGVTGLPRGMKNVAAPTKPLGSAQGGNDHGSLGYSGPRLAPGDSAHHYHLQVFALDRPTRVRPGAEYAAVRRAMQGHVLARGELVVTYALSQPKVPRPDRSSGATPSPGQPG
jgi:Raf kinase inhibitor-like YbhB/YbcL family protein